MGRLEKVLAWGTYDLGKPRTRILLQGLRENNVLLEECHSNVWAGVEDKSQIRDSLSKLKFLFKWLVSYPGLIFGFLRSEKPDVVFIGYLGQLDVLVIWLFAKIRKIPVLWDAHLSLYSTVVEDRRLINSTSLLARLLYFWEWLACRAADFVLLDTRAHARYFIRKYDVRPEKIGSVFVGAEPEFFKPESTKDSVPRKDGPVTVLFYGQFIPLHGIETIVQAAQTLTDPRVHWVIIGRGQVEDNIKLMMEEKPLSNLTWIPWVPYDQLSQQIHAADVCLGIFGDSDKASRVIPNKAFQIISCGRPLITRDSPAIRELVDPSDEGIYLVMPANPDSLVNALESSFRDLEILPQTTLHANLLEVIHPAAIGRGLVDLIEKLLDADQIVS